MPESPAIGRLGLGRLGLFALGDPGTSSTITATLSGAGGLTVSVIVSATVSGSGGISLSPFAAGITIEGLGGLTLTTFVWIGTWSVEVDQIDLFTATIRVEMPICYLLNKTIYTTQVNNPSYDSPVNSSSAINPMLGQ